MHADTVSTTADRMVRDRKNSKPIMEKRRRARINASLAELKSLLLEAIKKEGSRHSKMEKADILEMTVNHLRDLQKHTPSVSPQPESQSCHYLGFSECTQEVSKFLSNVTGCDVELRMRLLDHLANTITGTGADISDNSKRPHTEHISETDETKASSVPTNNEHPPPLQNTATERVVTDVNNNTSVASPYQTVQHANIVSGVQVLPTQLSSGEIVFLLPGNTQLHNYVMPIYKQSSGSPHDNPVAVSSAPIVTFIPSNDVTQTSSVTSSTECVVRSVEVSPFSCVSLSKRVDSDRPIGLKGDVYGSSQDAHRSAPAGGRGNYHHLNENYSSGNCIVGKKDTMQCSQVSDTRVWRPW